MFICNGQTFIAVHRMPCAFIFNNLQTGIDTTSIKLEAFFIVTTT